MLKAIATTDYMHIHKGDEVILVERVENPKLPYTKVVRADHPAVLEGKPEEGQIHYMYDFEITAI